MSTANPVSNEASRKPRMLYGHDIAAGVAHNAAHALPGVAYMLTTARGITVPILIQYGTLLVIAAQLTYWIFRISDLVSRRWRKRRQ